MEYCSKNWKTVIYVLGNHEFYVGRDKINKHNPRTKNGINIEEMVAKYKYVLRIYPNVYCLENECIDVGEYRIYGTTLWTKHNHNLNDSRFIKKEHIDYWSDNEKELLRWHLAETIKNTIVVTHFPVIQKDTSHPKFNDSELRDYFTWDNLLSDLHRDNLVACIAGHTHYSFDFVQDGVRMISNQFGYMDELKKGETRFKQDGLYTI